MKIQTITGDIIKVDALIYAKEGIRAFSHRKLVMVVSPKSVKQIIFNVRELA
jgi:hypothetical protein